MRWKSLIPVCVFVLFLFAFWAEVRSRNLEASVGGHVFSAFFCFSLLLAGEYSFGFGLAEGLRRHLSGESWKPRTARVLVPAILVVPYLVFAIPRGALDFRYAAAMAIFPVLCAALIEYSSKSHKIIWQDVVVLLSLALVLELRVFSGAWPYNGLGSLPKIYLADVALYVYLVVRRSEGVGYSLVPRIDAFLVGLREWVFFLPIVLVLGFALRFIQFYPRYQSPEHILVALVVIFFLTAIPEEIFFRGILQNLLEARYNRRVALVTTALLFGLSHFPKGAVFNWRYVILAAIAGIFYGRAWRAQRQILASATSHTLVDVIWGLWFR